MLVIHGLGRFAAEWLPCARAIDPNAVVPDLPELRVVDRKPDFAAIIAELLVLAQPIWLGHSGGGHLAVEAAVAHPDRIAKLIVVAATPSRELLSRVRCPLLVIDGPSHDPHLDTPAALVDDVRRFLRA